MTSAATTTVAMAMAVTVSAIIVTIMATTTTTAAAATAATAGLGKIIRSGNTAQLDGHGDVLPDLLLEAFQLALGVHELAGRRVFKQRIPRRFEGRDLGSAKLDAGMLLLMQLLPQLMHVLILRAGDLIVQEALDTGLELNEQRIRGDFGAEVFGLGNDGGIVLMQGHAHSITAETPLGNGQVADFPAKPPEKFPHILRSGLGSSSPMPTGSREDSVQARISSGRR